MKIESLALFPHYAVSIDASQFPRKGFAEERKDTASGGNKDMTQGLPWLSVLKEW